MPTLQHLELPSNTFDALEQIAQFQGRTLLGVIEGWVHQHKDTQNLTALRQEYQALIDKDLQRVLTPEEAERLEVICVWINTLEAQTDAYQHWQQFEKKMDARFEELQRTLSTFPEKDIKE